MTAGGFDRLLYTDCRAGTGRGAGGGFQVQAQSAGVDAAQSKMAVGWLLYDVPNAWIVQRRPVEEFPLGFAHAAEAGYGTAQSRYVGTEATGARQGNHLADCLLTRDLSLYGPTRPAQLWRSPLWRSQAWDTTDCPQLDDAPPLGPLTVDTVAEWLRARRQRAPVLARLLSVLEDPVGARVIITATEPDEALLWIAAATLLLPVRNALEVSFKVFGSNPMRVSHRIVAVPKDLNPQIAPGRYDSAFVLDADEASSDETGVSERAAFWTELFAGAEDPYDVVDAVEYAELLGAGTGPGGTDARATAWAVTVADSPLDDPSKLFSWLSRADRKLQEEHGAAVVRRILAAQPTPDMLRWIDAADGQLVVDRPAVRARLLTAEIAEVGAGAFPAREVLADVAADDSARRDADSELSSAMVLGADPQVDLLLRLSRRHRIELQLAPLQHRLRAFALGWIDNPASDYSPDDWALRDEILDMAYDELQARLARRGAPGVMDTLRQLSPYFASRAADLADPMDCYVQVAGMRRLQRKDQRASRLSELMQQALGNTRADEAFSVLQRALIDWQVLGPAESVAFLAKAPVTVPVSKEVIGQALGEIHQAAARPTAAVLDALGALHRRNAAPDRRPFTSLIAADLDIREFVDASRSARFTDDNSWARRCIKHLGGVAPPVVRARLRPLLVTCLDFPVPGLGAAVLGVLEPPLPELLIDRWARELGGQQGIRAAAWGVHWADDSRLEELRPRIAAALRKFGSELSPADREQWFLDVQDAAGPDQAKNWAELADHESARSRRIIPRFRGKDT